MSEMNEFRLRVPADLTRRFKGLSIDAGSSIVKFVYKSQEDQDEANSGDGKYGHIHLVMFPRSELSTALEYVRQRSVITRSDDAAERPTVCTTGFGCTQHGTLVGDTLSVKLQQLTEFDCFVKSFTYLAARLPRSEFLEPFLDEATVEPVESVKKQMEILTKLSDANLTTANFDLNALMAGIQLAICKPSDAALQAGDTPLSEAEPDMYPCLLALCGSGYGFMKVEQDGSFKFVDMSNRGGRSFFGLGSLLTGYKTFTELIEAASKGDQRGCDMFSNDLVKDMDSVEGEKSMYTVYGEESEGPPALTFCFGKTAGSELGKFKREDVARSLLNFFVMDVVQCVQLVSNCHGIKRVFFCGGFASTPLVRRLITAEWVRRNLYLMSFASLPPGAKFDFVKPGAHLGALGCVVHDVDNSATS